MAVKENPYKPGSGGRPPVLVGREAEMALAESQIDQAQAGRTPSRALFFTGQRGMGKTALLRMCAQEARRRGAIVLSAEGSRDVPLVYGFRRSLQRAERELTGFPKKLRDGLGALLGRLRYDLPRQPGELGAISFSGEVQAAALRDLVEVCEELADAAFNKDQFLLVTIDEVQDASRAELSPLFTLVHELADQTPPIVLWGAGLPGTAAHLLAVHTYTQRWRKIPLGLLSAVDTSVAIEQPARDRGVRVEEDALHLLIDASGGYPYFIQEYASDAWLKHNGNVITAADVRAIMPGTLLKLEQDLYEAEFQALTPRELQYVLALADLGAGAHQTGAVAERLGGRSADYSSVTSQVIRKGVALSPSRGLIQFRIPLVEAYIARHREELQRRASAYR